MQEQTVIKIVFGGYATIVLVAAVAKGVNGALAFGALGLLAGLAGAKIFNHVFRGP